ncbi:MAG: type II secretion system F family protein [Bacilli bacterium]|nr:type II secretion system F family protein [Bacilli bacterium]
MPYFRYKARNRDAYIVTDIMEAPDKSEVVRRIKNNNMVPLDVIELKLTSLLKGKEINITSGVSRQDLVFFLSQFYNLLHSGLSIIESLKIIIDQTQNKYLKKYLINILQDIRNGSPLHKALARQKKVFPKLMVEMVKVGEMIGKIEDVIYDMYIYYKKQLKTTNDIKGAMMYPIFMFVATIGVTIFLLTFVVPTFQSTFAEMGQDLPGVTQFILNVADFVKTKLIYVVLVIVLFITLALMFNRTDKGRMFYSNLALKLPLIKGIYRKGNLIRIASTYSTLLSNSVNAVEGLDITKEILTNRVFIDILDKASTNIQNGIPISKAFEKHWAVDPVFASMVAIGEETATLGVMLKNISEYYDAEMEVTVQRLKKFMEPIVLIILASIVGTILLAVMIPMFSMMETGVQ